MLFTINFLSPKLPKMKRNIRPKNLYLKFLKKSLKNCYLRKFDSYKHNMKKTWDTIKEVVVKTKTFKYDIGEMVVDEIETFD